MFKCSKCGGEDQNSDGSCARCSSASLREKLKALVEDMRERGGSPEADRYVRLNLYWYADQLTALLAESEPERNKLPFLCSCHSGSVCGEACRRGEHHSGCSWLGWRSAPSPDCEAKAKLPLGHAYCGTEDGRDCKVSVDYSPEGKCWLRCGQPRSAHEPRRGRLGR